jgi:predicted transcriptional regulator
MPKSATTQTIQGPAPDVLAAYLQNNKVPPSKLAEVIRMLSGVSASAPAATARASAVRPSKASGASVKTPAKVAAKTSGTSSAKTSAKTTVKAAAVETKVVKAKVRPRKEVAKAANTGSFVLDVAIPTRNLKVARSESSRKKFLGIRQVNDPAVPVEQSVLEDHIVCLEDGKKFKMMKRWLRASYGMSPDQYKAKWGLPEDYPMVAPGYAREKSDYARIQGLGTAENKQHKSASVRDLNQAVGRVRA